MARKLRSQNAKGQFTKGVSILISKKLQAELDAVAEECVVRIKPIIRDELERTYKDEVHASYRPATKTGKDVQKYNETHKHQKAAPYHHTGHFLESINAVIEGSVVKIKLKEIAYDDDTTTLDVYDYLSKGTTKRPKHDKYYIKGSDGIGLADYISTPKHQFDAHTLNHMKGFLDSLASDIRNHPKNYIKYTDKRKAKSLGLNNISKKR